MPRGGKRKGAGRPPIPVPTRMIHTRLTLEEVDALDELATKMGHRNRTLALRHLIAPLLSKRNDAKT